MTGTDPRDMASEVFAPVNPDLLRAAPIIQALLPDGCLVGMGSGGALVIHLLGENAPEDLYEILRRGAA